MAHASLQRTVGLPGAVGLGLGSILGTGVFVSIGLAAGVAGPAVIPAIALAALLAGANALSSAQLAAAFPVAGGTYEYGYRLLHPAAGFSAGWLFLGAKSASAAAAALGFAGYLLTLIGRPELPVSALAAATVVLLTAVVLGGLRRSTAANAVMLAVTIAALLAFMAAGLPVATGPGAACFGAGSPDGGGFFEATALMFVAYTGYGRIATLGEEVRDPRRIIPRAIVWTLAVSAVLYLGVAAVAVAAAGADTLAAVTAAHAAPLAELARSWNAEPVPALIAVGAMTAMLGVLLNLILGLSRVVLAMGRRGDLPGATARLNPAATTPTVAVALVGVAIAALAAFGNLRLAWSFSAFTVLVYYAVTNLCALRLPPGQRLYPRWIAAAGLIGCLGLACWIDRPVVAAGFVLLLVGWALRAAVRVGSAPRC